MERSVDTLAIRKLMIDNGVNSVSDLAKISGVSRATLCTVMSGKNKPSAEVMEKIATALRMDPETAGKIFFANNLRIA